VNALAVREFTRRINGVAGISFEHMTDARLRVAGEELLDLTAA
jgi:hypothetical protein